MEALTPTFLSRTRRDLSQLVAEPVVLGLVIASAVLLLYFVVYPLSAVFWESLHDDEGKFAGLANYLAFVASPYFRQVFYNTILISATATLAALVLGTLYAFAMTRTDIPGKPLFMVTAILPMITPPFVSAFAFILLLGRNGMINVFLDEWFGFKFIIYGWHGVVISQTLTTFPLAFLITAAAFSSFDTSLEDAAQDLGATDFYMLRTVTFPLITPALGAATLLIFMTNLSAFGAPALLGGGLSVLAVEAVIQTLGVLDWGMGTTISVILLVPSFLLFYYQGRRKEGRSYVTVTGAPVHAEARPTLPAIRWSLFTLCALVSMVVMAVYVVIVLGGVARVWGVDSTFTLEHYRLVLSNSWRSILNTMMLASVGALGATMVGLTIAYLIVRRRFLGRRLMDFLATLPYAVPGTMMGLGFVMAFNRPPLILTGTAFILILDYTIRRMPFALRTGVSTLQQIDVAVEEASADLGARWFTTFRKVVLPLMKPAFIAGVTFAFIRASTELTSTIFLVSPRWRVMSVDIYNFVEAGSLGAAGAMSTLMMAMIVLVLLVVYRATGVTVSMFRM
jgi:iron(III) transport system permease protein